MNTNDTTNGSSSCLSASEVFSLGVCCYFLSQDIYFHLGAVSVVWGWLGLFLLFMGLPCFHNPLSRYLNISYSARFLYSLFSVWAGRLFISLLFYSFLLKGIPERISGELFMINSTMVFLFEVFVVLWFVQISPDLSKSTYLQRICLTIDSVIKPHWSTLCLSCLFWGTIFLGRSVSMYFRANVLN